MADAEPVVGCKTPLFFGTKEEGNVLWKALNQLVVMEGLEKKN